MKKKIVYVDMDNTIVDFKSGIAKLSKEDQEQYKNNFDDHPEIFALMEPINGAKDALQKLNQYYKLYILSTAPWDNPNAWKQKREWVEKYFGKGEENIFYKKVILSHHKNLVEGDILIDDRPNNGAKQFKGKWIQFGSDKYPNWDTIVKKLEPRFYKTKSAIFLAIFSILIFLGFIYNESIVPDPVIDKISPTSIEKLDDNVISINKTTTTIYNEQLAIENFEDSYIKNYFKETFHLTAGESSVSYMSDWMGERLYFMEVDQVLTKEDLTNIDLLSINGVYCEKTFVNNLEAYLDRYHPWSKEIKDVATYKCNDENRTLLFGSPFYLERKWWIFKSAEFDFSSIECETPCQPATENFASLVQIDESSLIYNLYKPLSEEEWMMSTPWLQYLEYMWNIYWIFDQVDLESTQYYESYLNLFLDPAFRIVNDEDYLNCYLFGGVGMSGPGWIQGFFPQPVETITDKFNDYIIAGGNFWSWACYLDERENYEDSELYIYGSGPPIIYPNSFNIGKVGTGWVMYGTPNRPNNLVFEKGFFYPITTFYWFKDESLPSVDFVCDYLEENNVEQQDYFEPLYSDCNK